MSMEEFGDLFFVARDVRQKAFELLRHRANQICYLFRGQDTRAEELSPAGKRAGASS